MISHKKLDLSAMRKVVDYFDNDKPRSGKWAAYSYEGQCKTCRSHRHSICIGGTGFTEKGEAAHYCVATALGPNIEEGEDVAEMVAMAVELFASPPNARAILASLERLEAFDRLEAAMIGFDVMKKKPDDPKP